MAFGDTLMARLGLDTSGFKAGLQSATGELSSFAGKIASAFGVSVGVAGLEQGIAKVVEYGARVQDLSERFNVNAESLQRLGNAAELHGSSLEGVAKGFNRLEIAQSRALGGNDVVTESFAALGITLDDLKSLTPEEIMMKIGKSSMNAADMVRVLGRSALDLRPTLSGLADGTIEYGKAIAAIDIKNLKEASDLWKSWGQGFTVSSGAYLGEQLSSAKAAVSFWKDAFSKIKNSGISAWESILDAQKLGIVVGKAMKDAGKAPEKIDKPKRTFAPEGDGEKPKSEAELAAAKKERERNQSSLDHLAEMNPAQDVEMRNNAQAMYAHRQAQEVKRLEAQADRQRDLQDFTGASATRARADTMRQGISGLKESDKEVGQYGKAMRDALDSSTLLLSIHNKLDVSADL
ncbi:MAG TPA: hypothetical protein VF345_10915 [Chthoniobacterales bacterium]